jgi:diguanylate cyclase (GGDEF)-like protein
VDAAECRILADIDNAEALRVAEAGLRAAGPAPAGAAREPWLRLRSCHAGELIVRGDTAAGEAELAEILALSDEDELRSVHALALLERGLANSRRNDLLTAQPDLLRACTMLKSQRPSRDLDLCLGHLAKHYQRTGNYDEALHLLGPLRDAARKRGARFDDALHTYGIGEVQLQRADWTAALQSFREAAHITEATGDRLAESYAERGAAVALRRLGRASEGLTHIEKAIGLIDEAADPGHLLRSRLTRAHLLTALDRSAESNPELLRLEPAVRALHDDWYTGEWLSARADALMQAGAWREAYQALRDWSELEAQVQKRRLSEQAARMRMEFNRARDTEELDTLRELNEQGQQLRLTQNALLGALAVMLSGLIALGLRKLGQMRRLQVLAATDDLTGLPNRRALEAHAADVMRRLDASRGRLSVLMVDVDHFKHVNDAHGHAVGDIALQHLARLLPKGLRDADRCGRVGGEEFLVLLPGAAATHAAQIAERMRSTISETPLVGPSGPLRMTVSIGVAELVVGSESYAALVGRADQALYRAKAAGRNRVAIAEAPSEPARAGAPPGPTP